MNRAIQKRRDQITDRFVREIEAALDRDLEDSAHPIADSELDETGNPRRICGYVLGWPVFRNGRWWEIKYEVLLKIARRLPRIPPLRVVK